MILEGGILTGDSPLYLKKFAILRQSLLSGDWHFLFAHDEQVHVKLYALSYTILSPLFGDSVLSFELANFPLFLLAVRRFYFRNRCGKYRRALSSALCFPVFNYDTGS